MTYEKSELRRAEQPTPTEPGWYYGKFNTAHVYRTGESREILPHFVQEHREEHVLCVFLPRQFVLPLNEFTWFGPVPICVESGT